MEWDKLRSCFNRLYVDLAPDTVSFEQVYSLIQQFEQLLASTAFEQRKTLLHMVIKRINLSSDKKIETIELTFDEKTSAYFFALSPSAHF